MEQILLILLSFALFCVFLTLFFCVFQYVNDMTECGLDMESAEHFLLHCTRHQEARNELQLSLQEIMDSSACTSRLYLSESILLAPRWNNVGCTRYSDTRYSDTCALCAF